MYSISAYNLLAREALELCGADLELTPACYLPNSCHYPPYVPRPCRICPYCGTLRHFPDRVLCLSALDTPRIAQPAGDPQAVPNRCTQNLRVSRKLVSIIEYIPAHAALSPVSFPLGQLRASLQRVPFRRHTANARFVFLQPSAEGFSEWMSKSNNTTQ